MKAIALLATLLLATTLAHGQTRGLTVGASGQVNPPEVGLALTNAWLTFRGIGSLTAGSMTTTQRDALSPTNGMVIYNTTESKLQFYSGGQWIAPQDVLELGAMPASLNLTNWSLIDTNILLSLQFGSTNLTNWAELDTNVLSGFEPTLGFAPQVGSANVTNWSAIDTNVLSTFYPASVSVMHNVGGVPATGQIWVAADDSGTNSRAAGATVSIDGHVNASSFTDGTGNLRQDLLVAEGDLFSLNEALQAFQTEAQNIAAEWTMSNLVLPKVPTYSITTNTGTAFEYDWDGAPVQLHVVQGEATRTAIDAPTGDVAVWGPIEIILTDQSTNCSLSQIDGHILFGRTSVGGVVPTEIAPDTVIFYQALYTPTYTWFFWRGNQDAPLSAALGGTGVTTGIAPDGMDVLGDWSITQTTNYFPDLASGTVFRLPNNVNPYIGLPASRVSSTVSNSLVITRRIEMLPASAERIIGIDTNYYSLSGIGQFTTNPAGVPFTATLINWGPETSNSIVFASLSTNVAAAGGGGGGEIPAPLFVLEFEEASAPMLDATGNGYNFSATGGSFTHQVTGKLGYAITNSADSSLVYTNPAPALQRAGPDSWSFSMWVWPQATGSLVAGQNQASTETLWMLSANAAGWRPYWSTNGTGTFNYISDFSVTTTDWQHILLVYDATVPEFKISKNGASFDTSGNMGNYMFDGGIPMAIGGYFSSGMGAVGSQLGAYDQVAYWDVALTLSQGQYIYNSGSGRTYATWDIE